jgi:hypothetical protein
MTREAPSNWISYIVVFGTVIAMMYGKYLIVRGDKNKKVDSNDKS